MNTWFALKVILSFGVVLSYKSKLEGQGKERE